MPHPGLSGIITEYSLGTVDAGAIVCNPGNYLKVVIGCEEAISLLNEAYDSFLEGDR